VVWSEVEQLSACCVHTRQVHRARKAQDKFVFSFARDSDTAGLLCSCRLFSSVSSLPGPPMSHRVWQVMPPRTLLLSAPPSTTRPQLLILTADAMILAAPLPQVFWGASFFLSTASLRMRPGEALASTSTGIVMVAVPATLNVSVQVMVLVPEQLPEPSPA
jgi:hypothetical protein